MRARGLQARGRIGACLRPLPRGPCGSVERFELRFSSLEEFEQELSVNLRKGRTFLRGVQASADRAPCQLVVEHPVTGQRVELSGQVVFAQPDGPAKGVGIELTHADLEGALRLFSPSAEPPGEPLLELEPPDDARSSRPGSLPPDNVHLRVRKLSPAQREKLAKTGNLAERVALERAFGASVWDGLLQNSQITGAEVARIAKNGMAPATLLGQIAANRAWLARAEVRRALLSNRRLGPAQVETVLRALPAPELRLLVSQTAYPVRVREAARKMLHL